MLNYIWTINVHTFLGNLHSEALPRYFFGPNLGGDHGKNGQVAVNLLQISSMR